MLSQNELENLVASTKPVERWAFSKSELEHPQELHNYDDLVAFVPCSEVAVFVERNGTVSNRYVDGTKGVPAEVAELADGIESLGHPKDGDNYTDLEETDCWRNVHVNEDGSLCRLRQVAPARDVAQCQCADWPSQCTATFPTFRARATFHLEHNHDRQRDTATPGIPARRTAGRTNQL
jgi:hypothetical protein